jgi:hypothetical protein
MKLRIDYQATTLRRAKPDVRVSKILTLQSL